MGWSSVRRQALKWRKGGGGSMPAACSAGRNKMSQNVYVHEEKGVTVH